MSYGETYRDVRSDGVPIRALDILPGSQDEAEFLKQRGIRIAKELCRAALNGASFDWFSPLPYNDIFYPPEDMYDTRRIAPVIHLSTFRNESSRSPM